MALSVLRQFFVVCLCFIILAGVPLVPRRLDRWVPIPIDGLSWHELLESIFMYILAVAIFSLYYNIVTLNKVPVAITFVPILLSLAMSIEGNGIHWSCNAIHSSFNPGNEKTKAPLYRLQTLYSLTYFLDEIYGHHLMIGGNCLSFLIIYYAEYLCIRSSDTYSVTWIDIFLFYTLSLGLGLVFFAAGIEGQTATTLILPFSAIIIVQTMMFRSQTTTFYSIRNFLCGTSVIATCLTLLWGWYFSWTFPEFRVLGLGPFSTWIGQFLQLLKRLVKY